MVFPNPFALTSPLELTDATDVLLDFHVIFPNMAPDTVAFAFNV